MAHEERERRGASCILIADLSVGKLGRDASALLGAMLVGMFGLAALSRVDMPIGQRRDFYLYGQRWDLRAFALAEAEDKRQELEREGWLLKATVERRRLVCA